MWSVIFCVWIWQIAFIDPTIPGHTIQSHTILLAGMFFTAEIFRRARKVSDI